MRNVCLQTHETIKYPKNGSGTYILCNFSSKDLTL